MENNSKNNQQVDNFKQICVSQKHTSESFAEWCELSGYNELKNLPSSLTPCLVGEKPEIELICSESADPSSSASYPAVPTDKSQSVPSESFEDYNPITAFLVLIQSKLCSLINIFSERVFSYAQDSDTGVIPDRYTAVSVETYSDYVSVLLSFCPKESSVDVDAILSESVFCSSSEREDPTKLSESISSENSPNSIFLNASLMGNEVDQQPIPNIVLSESACSLLSGSDTVVHTNLSECVSSEINRDFLSSASIIPSDVQPNPVPEFILLESACLPSGPNNVVLINSNLLVSRTIRTEEDSDSIQDKILSILELNVPENDSSLFLDSETEVFTDRSLSVTSEIVVESNSIRSFIWDTYSNSSSESSDEDICTEKENSSDPFSYIERSMKYRPGLRKSQSECSNVVFSHSTKPAWRRIRRSFGQIFSCYLGRTTSD